MSEPAKRDANVPVFFEIAIKGGGGKTRTAVCAQAKDFSTVSTGCYGSEKAARPESCGQCRFALTGSKSGK
jgi:hypothetical protein